MPVIRLSQSLGSVALLVFSTLSSAQADKADVVSSLNSDYERYQSIAEALWSSPELGYLEVESTRLLQSALEEEGFSLEKGVAGMPTAFTATYGTSGPIIGILGEYDALPGMSQAAVPYEEPMLDGAPGQACGHHLFGTASLAAAIAVKNWLVDSGTPGTIRYYGTPAEEGGSGKVYMVRAGLFNDVDAVISWHAGDANTANPGTNLATISGKFRFSGRSSHAAAAPERGRSALDGVEAMNDMVNMLREHTTEPTRIHYVITDGGNAPNIVPKTAEVYYVIRHEDVDEVRSVWDRVVRTAEGAAIGTETEMEYEIIGGTYPRLPNETLAGVLHSNLSMVGGVEYSEDDVAFAREIQGTLPGQLPAIESAGEVQPMVFTKGKASADTGDVSWNVPMAAMRAATWVPGTPAHSWQAVAAGGTAIGYKGMMVAAKTLALSAMDLYKKPEMLKKAKSEFDDRTGPEFRYSALLGDRAPALDYRR
ncbi:amidohydrolase [Congregibacter brevis]|uniref:Amidohydrolase n=1 Tax=Congregibacter brevis TaxID=3081201 RepID=A0ABZ0IJ13_9GAMM|nr:amidohydrolase [Congregibacter sp. IMCC45268]